MQVEYRVRPVTRYIVTRFHEDKRPDGTEKGSSELKGEFHSHEAAYEIAYALARDEHERLGYPIGDGRIQYPAPLMAEAA